MTIEPSLAGFTIGVTADRRAGEQGELLERRGASVVFGPSIVTDYLSDDDALRTTTNAIINAPSDIVVANTAIGMRAWIESASAWGLADALLAALARAEIAARGPKAASMCIAAGLTVAWQAPGERLDEMLTVLIALGVQGKRIVVQLHGNDAADFVDGLRRHGAEVVEVPVYKYRPPDDVAAAVRLIEAACEGRLHAITFTTRPALQNLFAIASEAALRDDLVGAFRDGVVCACIGPVCAEGATAEGIANPCYPETGRLGLMVRAVTDELTKRRRTIAVGAVSVVVQGDLVAVGDDLARLPPREAALFAALIAQPDAVVARPTLVAKVWGKAEKDTRVLDVTVARLRRRLEGLGLAIAVVPRRGYRLVAGVPLVG